MNHKLQNLILLLLGLLLVSGVAAGERIELAVGSAGEVISLHQGSYADLFPELTELEADASVLVLGTEDDSGSRWLLVPGSESVAEEQFASFYSDPTTGVTYIFWASRLNGVHPYLRLIAFDGEWGEVLDITGSVFGDKLDPSLSVQHDSTVDSDGNVMERVVLNVFWREEGRFGAEEYMKTLVLENGERTGSSSVVTLGELFPDKSPGFGDSPGAETPLRLVERDLGLLAAFTDHDRAQTRVLLIDVLPYALSRIASRVEAAVRDWDPFSGVSLASTVSEAVQAAGGDEIHPAVQQALIEDLLAFFEEHLGSSPSQADVDVLDKIHPHVVGIGARLKAGGLVGEAAEIIRIDSVGDERSHHLGVTEIASWPLPETGDAPQLFISKRGTAALVAWDGDDTVAYRETNADGWSEVQSIEITDTLDRESIYRILEERALER